MKVKIECTDIFQGIANYSWVNREEINLKDDITDLGVIRKCKKAMGYNGVKAKKEDYGDLIKLDFSVSGILHVMFITFDY